MNIEMLTEDQWYTKSYAVFTPALHDPADAERLCHWTDLPSAMKFKESWFDKGVKTFIMCRIGLQEG